MWHFKSQEAIYQITRHLIGRDGNALKLPYQRDIHWMNWLIKVCLQMTTRRRRELVVFINWCIFSLRHVSGVGEFMLKRLPWNVIAIYLTLTLKPVDCKVHNIDYEVSHPPWTYSPYLHHASLFLVQWVVVTRAQISARGIGAQRSIDLNSRL